MFSAERLVLARKRRKLTQVRLAELAGVSASLIRQYEHGRCVPPEGTIETLASALRFPPQFLVSEPVDEIPVGAASFRALSKTPAAVRDAALAAGALAAELCAWVEEKFSLPATDIPDLGRMTPEEAADQVRAAWALGEAPIRNMVHLLEVHGVRVFSLAHDTKTIDAFCAWKGETPFVFLNTSKSGERSRFDAAHELGHLVLHRTAEDSGRDLEVEANQFASAFLMPKGSLVANAPRSPSVDRLLDAKKIWRVSVAALAHRLFSSGLLSEWHYRHLCIELSRRGYRRTEPEPMPRETSQVLAKVFDQLRREGISKAQIAEQLRISPRDLDSLVFGLVITAVD